MNRNDAAAQLKECPVCHDVYNTDANLPKVFGVCGHSVCAVCVPLCTSQGRATCPLCRQETPVPPNGLPTNYDLREVVESAQAARRLADIECSACHKNVPSSECFACKTCSGEEMISVCALCVVDGHWGHTVFKHDTLVSREQIDAVAVKRRAYSDDRHRLADIMNERIESACNAVNGLWKNFRANPYKNEEFTFPSFLTKEDYERRVNESNRQSSDMARVFDGIVRAATNFRDEVGRIRVDEPQPSTSQVRQPAAPSTFEREATNSESDFSSFWESFPKRDECSKPACSKRSKYC